MATFKDHFSGHAEAYASARPGYPDALFEYLQALCAHHDCAWDCATGNGQAARSLAGYFRQVIASDASSEQIAAAAEAGAVEYRVAAAEHSCLPAASVDLVTVAQALHWFDIDAFFAEAGRVLRPAGVLAVWCYGTCTIDDAGEGEGNCDRIVQDYYRRLDPWWPPERDLVENGYRDISLPGARLDCPAFRMTVEWTAAQMLGYLRSWSATEHCRRASGGDPLAATGEALTAAWGEGPRTVSWPLYVKASVLCE